LCSPPDELPLDERGVDRAADLIGDEVATDLYPSSLRIYLHLRQVHTIRIGHVLNREGAAGAKTRLLFLGYVAVRLAGGCDLP
jgi:hypothetical protein